MSVLQEKDCLWAITYTSRDDGHRLQGPVFSHFQVAHSFSDQNSYGLDQQVTQTRLWYDPQTHRYYKIHKEEVKVDEETNKAEGLKKLSIEEKRALGLEA